MEFNSMLLGATIGALVTFGFNGIYVLSRLSRFEEAIGSLRRDVDRLLERPFSRVK